jgi:hypothetical protein
MLCSDPQGRVALMLCESTLHVLVEAGLLTKAKAIEAIETVAELTRETAESDPSVTSQIAVDLVEGIAASFTLQDSTPSRGFT